MKLMGGAKVGLHAAAPADASRPPTADARTDEKFVTGRFILLGLAFCNHRIQAELAAQYEQSRALTHDVSMRGRGLGFQSSFKPAS